MYRYDGPVFIYPDGYRLDVRTCALTIMAGVDGEHLKCNADVFTHPRGPTARDGLYASLLNAFELQDASEANRLRSLVERSQRILTEKESKAHGS